MPRRDYLRPVERITRPGRVSRPEFRLLLSPTSDKADTDNAPLQGRTVSGTVFIFIEPQPDITNVKFYVDGALVDEDNVVPWDIGSSAGGYDTTALSNGTHTVRADITASGTVYSVQAVFTVSNGGGSAQLGQGIAYFKLSGGNLASNPSRYDYLIVSEGGGTAANSYTVPGIGYYNLQCCSEDGYTGMSQAEARSNGWLLLNSSGGEIVNSGYSYLRVADIGNTAYVDKWCQNVLARLQSYGYEGFYQDDVRGLFDYTASYPPSYPNKTAWQNAVVSSCERIYNYFDARGYYVAGNAYDWSNTGADNTGDTDLVFYQRLAGKMHGIMKEYILWPNQTFPPRREGTNWYQNWSGWRRLQQQGNTLGYDFWAFDAGAGNGSQDSQQLYCLATFLLDWERPGSTFIWSTSLDGGDPWQAAYDLLPVGQPLGAATLSGQTWTRQFTNRTVQVNPYTGTASIT